MYLKKIILEEKVISRLGENFSSYASIKIGKKKDTKRYGIEKYTQDLNECFYIL